MFGIDDIVGAFTGGGGGSSSSSVTSNVNLKIEGLNDQKQPSRCRAATSRSP